MCQKQERETMRAKRKHINREREREREGEMVSGNDLPWQQVLKHGNSPFFHGFWQHCVICERIDFGHNVPRLVPLQSFHINEQSHQLWNAKRRVRIVELNGHLVRELGPWASYFFESSNNVFERSTNKKVLVTNRNRNRKKMRMRMEKRKRSSVCQMEMI